MHFLNFPVDLSPFKFMADVAKYPTPVPNKCSIYLYHSVSKMFSYVHLRGEAIWSINFLSQETIKKQKIKI
jgi:hypothetical protein